MSVTQGATSLRKMTDVLALPVGQVVLDDDDDDDDGDDNADAGTDEGEIRGSSAMLRSCASFAIRSPAAGSIALDWSA